MHPQPQSNFFRLPVELRTVIYEEVLGLAKTRPLYIARDIWAWKTQSNRRSHGSRDCTFLNVLLTCQRVHDEAADVIYRKIELCLITDCTQDVSSLCRVRRRICPIEDYANILKRVHIVRLTLFVTGQLHQANVIVALLSWIKAVLAESETPLRRMTVEFCATCWKLECRPTAVIYAAQGFRDRAPTRFEFPCGFSGIGSEDAMLALAEHAGLVTRSFEEIVTGLEQHRSNRCVQVQGQSMAQRDAFRLTVDSERFGLCVQ